MIDSKDSRLGRIKIKSIPNGDAPQRVKEKWIGVEIPCLYYDPACFGKEVISKKPADAQPVYVVVQKHALEALSQLSPQAVVWWNAIGYPQNDTAVWIFNADCVEVLKPPLSKGHITGELN